MQDQPYKDHSHVNSKQMSDSNSHIHFTAADIERYHKGLLSPGERHALEKAALDDPFLADALEGYQYTDTPAADLNLLREKLAEKLNTAKVIPLKGGMPPRSFAWWKAAAVVILLAGAGWLTFRFGLTKKDNELAIKTEQPQKAKEASPAEQGTPGVNDSAGKYTADGDSEEKNAGNANKPVKETAAPAGSVTPSDETVKMVPGNLREEISAAPEETKLKAEAERSKEDVAVTPPSPVSEKKYEGDLGNNKPVLTHAEPASLPRAQNASAGYNDFLKKDFGNQARARKAEDVTLSTNQQPAAGMVNNLNRSYNFTGRVVDANNNALPFANVTNLNDNVGTYADARGNFTLISTDSVLNVQARSIGFEARNYTLQQNNTRQNQIILQDDRNQKDEYVANTKNVKVNAEKLKERGSMKDETPEPADGWGNYNTYVANNIELPENVKQKQKGGEVEVSFDVDKNGTPVNVKITRSLCTECDAEVIRLVKEGPKWKRSSKKAGKATVTVSF